IPQGASDLISRRYGLETSARVREIPYRRAAEVFGIGFRTADAIAREMGVPADSPLRAQAALLHLLAQAAAEGHVFLPKQLLLSRAAKLEIPHAAREAALAALAREKEIVLEDEPPGEARVFPAFLLSADVPAASRFARVCRQGDSAQPPLMGGGRAGAEREFAGGGAATARVSPGGDLTEEQRRAVAKASEPGPGLLVITGGPGTGKTTTLRAIVAALEAQGRAYLLAAPTGRAAK